MERVKTFIQERLLPEEAEKLYQQGAKFEEIMMMYGCALREVQTKLEVLNDELSVRYNRNPIEFIKTRVKKPLSIVNKLQRRGLEVSIESMVENLNDVAGIRVICDFLDDIYDVARWLSSQDDIRLLQVKNYIKNPKPNGYRSLHPDCGGARLFLKRPSDDAGGGADPDHRHGLLGEPRASAQLQKRRTPQRGDRCGIEGMRGGDLPYGPANAGNPRKDRYFHRTYIKLC